MAAEKYRWRIAERLYYLIEKKDCSSDVECLYDYRFLCEQLLILMTDPKISKCLPKSIQKHLGKRLNNMVDFFESIAESEIIQGEMDLLYIKQAGTKDEDIAKVVKRYQ